jgi:hypothetical protein
MLESGPARFLLEGIGEEDRGLLEYLRQEFRKSYDHYLRVIRETGVLSKDVLEKKTTVTSNRRNISYPIDTDILANTRQCARDKAVDCVRLYRSRKQRNLQTEFPEFMYDTVNPRLNWRDGYVIKSDGTVRISVKKGARVYAHISGSYEDMEQLMKAFGEDFRLAAAEISKEGEDYFIHVSALSDTRCED